MSIFLGNRLITPNTFQSLSDHVETVTEHMGTVVGHLNDLRAHADTVVGHMETVNGHIGNIHEQLSILHASVGRDGSDGSDGSGGGGGSGEDDGRNGEKKEGEDEEEEVEIDEHGAKLTAQKPTGETYFGATVYVRTREGTVAYNDDRKEVENFFPPQLVGTVSVGGDVSVIVEGVQWSVGIPFDYGFDNYCLVSKWGQSLWVDAALDEMEEISIRIWVKYCRSENVVVKLDGPPALRPGELESGTVTSAGSGGSSLPSPLESGNADPVEPDIDLVTIDTESP
ncbi:hypothetical protein FACS189472_11930 [Alphaproteobacteria bacterium]|nr:hypothetical protein FACS189472_11930 [Alphaproteobacteria bacterium]